MRRLQNTFNQYEKYDKLIRQGTATFDTNTQVLVPTPGNEHSHQHSHRHQISPAFSPASNPTNLTSNLTNLISNLTSILTSILTSVLSSILTSILSSIKSHRKSQQHQISPEIPPAFSLEISPASDLTSIKSHQQSHRHQLIALKLALFGKLNVLLNLLLNIPMGFGNPAVTLSEDSTGLASSRSLNPSSSSSTNKKLSIKRPLLDSTSSHGIRGFE
ncbi:hypothetical protein Pst134EB_016537 [Puccinia striiformis f. sp. tritici]|nr:hypothetical protein Pst134EB_016537 [Puccinia striiformis f. sp. tritici]